MTQKKLLVITNDHHMSDTQRAEFTARVQLIAEKVGAELLVLDPGQCAGLMNGPAIQGEVISSCLDPLEQAIESTVRMLRDEHQQMAETGAQQDTALCDRLGAHLDALLAEQLNRVQFSERH